MSCNNPEHNHENEQDDLMSAIAEIETPEEIASVAIQIFCAVANLFASEEMAHPVFSKAFEPYKALAEKLGVQEITDIVITTEMEHNTALALVLSKLRHPAFEEKSKRKKWGKN